MPSASESAAAKVIFLAGPPTRPSFYFSCNPPMVWYPSYFSLHSMSFHPHFVREFYIKYQLIHLTCPSYIGFNACYTVKSEPSRIFQIIKCSLWTSALKEKNPKNKKNHSLVYQIADFLCSSSIWFLVIILSFPSSSLSLSL